jgi:hypothetical protein
VTTTERDEIEPELPEEIPASKEPVEPILEKAFKKEPRHADEGSAEDE